MAGEAEAMRAVDQEDQPEALRVRGTPLALNDTIRLLHSRKSIRNWVRGKDTARWFRDHGDITNQKSLAALRDL